MAQINMATPTVRPPNSLQATQPLEEDDSLTESAPQAITAPPVAEDQTITEQAPLDTTPVRGPDGLDPPDRAGDSGLDGAMTGFAQDALNNPSRWGSSLVTSGIAQINAELEDSSRRAMSAQDEMHSARGLTGSNVEAWNQKDMRVGLERVKSDRLHDLATQMANTYGADRNSAANIGLATGNFLEGQDRFDTGVQQWGSEFREGQTRFDTGTDQWDAQYGFQQGRASEADRAQLAQEQFTKRAQDLQAQGMSEDEAFRQAQMEMQKHLADQSSQLSQHDIYLRALAAGAGDNLPDVDDPNTPWDDTKLQQPDVYQFYPDEQNPYKQTPKDPLTPDPKAKPKKAPLASDGIQTSEVGQPWDGGAGPQIQPPAPDPFAPNPDDDLDPLAWDDNP